MGSTMVESSPDVTGPWIDNHCHLDPDPDTPTEVVDDDAPTGDDLVAEARRSGVVAMVTVGTDPISSRRCIERARRTEGVWATAGVHPHDAAGGLGDLLDVIDHGRELAALVAVGECGLDYHYDHSPREVQRRIFAEQIGIAHTTGLPLVIHTREAWDDTLSILEDLSTPERTVFHCFTGGAREAERCLGLGAVLSISGIVTFKSADDVRDAVRIAPLESIMVETDSPFLAPVPHRGQPNRPALVALVGAEVARQKGLEVAAVAAATTATAAAFYGLDL